MIPRTPPSDPTDREIAELCRQQGRDPQALLPVLQAVQARRGTLAARDIHEVALGLRIPAGRARGVASFYSMLSPDGEPAPGVRVCDGPVCWLAAGRPARDELLRRPTAGSPVTRSSCLGLCDRAPAALVGARQVGPVQPGEDLAGRAAASAECSTYDRPRPGETRVLLDPGTAPWDALAVALDSPPAAVIEALERSGLRGRGGAGFPSGKKWRTVAEGPAPRFIVCDADESEPLLFKDRVLLDAAPDRVLAGMALAAWAVGAEEGIVYVRGEYAAQAARIERAVAEAEARGRLGEAAFAGRLRFRVRVHRGAGAYICGEETALLESLAGRRGEPRIRPPFPATSGMDGRPTLVSNVETFAAAPDIVRHGPEWFRALGRRGAAGTKLYTVLGAVQRPGLVEAPLGLSLRELIDDLAGGLRPGARFRFALVGGAAGVLVPASGLDAPLAYRDTASAIDIGSGGVLIGDDSVPLPTLMAQLLWFFEVESCGKCTPCRIGTYHARLVLDRIAAGAGSRADVDELERLAGVLLDASFCGLGVAAGRVLRSALTSFRGEFS